MVYDLKSKKTYNIPTKFDLSVVEYEFLSDDRLVFTAIELGI